MKKTLDKRHIHCAINQYAWANLQLTQALHFIVYEFQVVPNTFHNTWLSDPKESEKGKLMHTIHIKLKTVPTVFSFRDYIYNTISSKYPNELNHLPIIAPLNFLQDEVAYRKSTGQPKSGWYAEPVKQHWTMSKNTPRKVKQRKPSICIYPFKKIKELPDWVIRAPALGNKCDRVRQAARQVTLNVPFHHGDLLLASPNSSPVVT